MAFFQRGLRPSLLRVHLRSLTRLPRSAPQSRSLSSPAETAYTALIAGPTAVLDILHAVGLPWFAAIPVSAILIRGVSGYFITQWQRRHALRQLALVPLAEAWNVNNLNDQRMRSDLKASRSSAATFSRFYQAFRYRQKLNEISRNHGLPPGVHWVGPLANMSILLSVGEAIRLKAGATQQGLLSLVLTPLDWINDYFRGFYTALYSGLHGTPPPMDTTSISDQFQLPELSQYADPSLHVGGIPGWCLDLTLQDPTLLLPLIFAAGWMYNILSVTSKTYTPGKTPTDNLRQLFSKLTNGQRIGMSVGLVIAVASGRLPAGILLYLVSSTWTGIGVRALIRRKYPSIAPIRACKLPMRYTARREWHEV